MEVKVSYLVSVIINLSAAMLFHGDEEILSSFLKSLTKVTDSFGMSYTKLLESRLSSDSSK